MSLHLVRQHDRLSIVTKGKIALQYFARARGLIGVKKFHEGEGLLFPQCKSIHMWMMSISIDVVFLKETKKSMEWSIVKIAPQLKPWKILPVSCLNADDVLELPVGSCQKYQLKEGEVLCIAL